eukprot:4584116-Karenia_brevis.AAC.1
MKVVIIIQIIFRIGYRVITNHHHRQTMTARPTFYPKAHVNISSWATTKKQYSNCPIGSGRGLWQN